MVLGSSNLVRDLDAAAPRLGKPAPRACLLIAVLPVLTGRLRPLLVCLCLATILPVWMRTPSRSLVVPPCGDPAVR